MNKDIREYIPYSPILFGALLAEKFGTGAFLAGVTIFALEPTIVAIYRGVAGFIEQRNKSSGKKLSIIDKREGAHAVQPAQTKRGHVARKPALPANVIVNETPRKPVYRGIPRITFDIGAYHFMVAGATGSGKSSVFNLFVRTKAEEGADILIIDPHFKPGTWPSSIVVAGGGRNYDEVADVFRWLGDELSRRYELRYKGNADFYPLWIVIDEYMAIAQNTPDAIDTISAILAEGRKVKMFLIIASQSRLIKSLGASGRGDIFSNVTTIQMPSVVEREDAPRIVDIYIGGLGTKRYKGTHGGVYAVPPPVEFTGVPNTDVASFISDVISKNGGVSQMGGLIADTGINADTVSRGVSGAKFKDSFKRDTPCTAELIRCLSSLGYGVRKIGEFLPMRNSDARALVRKYKAEKRIRERIAPGTNDEAQLVVFLCDVCKAPIERVARLLEGSDDVCAVRIQSILDE